MRAQHQPDTSPIVTRGTARVTAALDVDGRRKSCKRFRELMGAYAEELGGVDRLDVVQIATLRNVVAMQMTAERFQLAIARGEPVDSADLAQVINVSQRLLAKLRREARPAVAA
jgi:hypothetical protein